MPDTKIGNWSGQELYLRQTGGHDDAVIEAGETIDLVMRPEGGGCETILSPADRAQALSHLGIRSLSVGTLVGSVANYVESYQGNKKWRFFCASDLAEVARGGHFGINQSWVMVSSI